jgi:acetylserotonin N-methyltransferase
MNQSDPAPVLELIDAFRRSKTMFAAVGFGVFDRLEETPASASTLARELGADEDALERLLDACVGLGLLQKSGTEYSNQPVATTYLRRSSPETMAGYLLYSNNALFRMWANLEDAIREGSNRWRQTFGLEAPLFHHFFKSEDAKRDFLMGMHGFGRLSSPRVVAAFDLGRFRRLVDLGGATGHLAVAACDRYPHLHAAVLDLPAVIEVSNEYVSRAVCRDRIELIAGDFFADPLPEADLFSCGRILHDWSEDKIRKLLAKAFHRLPSAGALLIAERILDENKRGPLGAQLQSLNMLVCTEGKERTLAEYTALLRQAGFAEVQGRKTGAPLDAILAVKS